MPSLVPRISDKTRFLDAFWRIWRCWVYLGHSRRIWFLVSRVSSLHGHAVGSGERGRKEFLNSPVYVWPVRHCSTRPNTSRLFLSFSKCLVGFRDGFSRFAMANLPTFGECFHSICQSLRTDDLARLLAFEWVALNGIWQPSSVASLASWSALSLPSIPQWLGHQEIETLRFSWVSRSGLMIWWNLIAKNWAVLGLGSTGPTVSWILCEKMCLPAELT